MRAARFRAWPGGRAAGLGRGRARRRRREKAGKRAPTRCRTGAPRLSVSVTLGVPASGPPRCVTAPGDPLRGRHLHRTQPITVQWTTSFSGPTCHGGTQPSRSRQPPKPRGPRANPIARANWRRSLSGAGAGVNYCFPGVRALAVFFPIMPRAALSFRGAPRRRSVGVVTRPRSLWLEPPHDLVRAFEPCELLLEREVREPTPLRVRVIVPARLPHPFIKRA